MMRGTCGLLMRQPDDFRRYVDAVLHAMWVAPRNLGDAAELGAALTQAGFDAEAFTALVSDAEVKADLVARGVFGAPTCFVGERLFFGQDRLDFVREALDEPTLQRP